MDIRHKGEFSEWWVPALDKDGNSTWPDVWTTEALLEKRKLDQRAFDHQYMLKPFSEADIVFNFDTVLLGAGDDAVPNSSWHYFFGVDLAASLDRGAAYSSVFVIGIDPNEQRPVRHAVEVIREKMRAPEFMDVIIDAAQRYDPVCIMVENNAYQQSMIDFLEATGKELPVHGYRTGAQKLDLQTGVPAVAPLFGRELFKYPVNIAHIDSGCDCTFCQWLEELKMFPSGKTSDTVMAMWLSERAYSLSRDFVTGYESSTIYTDSDFHDEDRNEMTEIEDSDDVVGDGSMVDWL
jgi:phage terminase large subunit-like protein